MVAINTEWVAFCKERLKDTTIHVGAAIGFPLDNVLYQLRSLRQFMRLNKEQMKLIMLLIFQKQKCMIGII